MKSNQSFATSIFQKITIESNRLSQKVPTTNSLFHFLRKFNLILILVIMWPTQESKVLMKSLYKLHKNVFHSLFLCQKYTVGNSANVEETSTAIAVKKNTRISLIFHTTQQKVNLHIKPFGNKGTDINLSIRSIIIIYNTIQKIKIPKH